MNNPTLRILHVVGGIDPGGVETWLLSLASDQIASGAQVQLATASPSKLSLQSEFQARGVRVHIIGKYGSPIPHVLKLRSIISEHQPHVVHVHTNIFAFLSLLAVMLTRHKPRTIVHSHNGSFILGTSFIWHLLRSLNRLWCSSGATAVAGCTRGALLEIVSEKRAATATIVPYGIDLTAFDAPPVPDFGPFASLVASAELVAVMPARFVLQKNHERAVNIWAEVTRLRPGAVLLLCGTGPLEVQIRTLVVEKGLSRNVLFLGSRRDVPSILHHSADVLLLPSQWEGYPVSLIEAQAARVPFVASDRIDRVVMVVPDSGHFVDLGASDSQWAEVLVSAVLSEPLSSFIELRYNLSRKASSRTIAGLYSHMLGERDALN